MISGNARGQSGSKLRALQIAAPLLPRGAARTITARMKTFLASILLVGACLAFAACENDLPPGEPAAQKLERGVTGQGTVYQPDKSNDPLIREQTRVGY